MNRVRLIECPRDAMQGIPQFIPTDLKVKYINQLLRVGFDTIDVGSFVSPKAIPQMKDTGEVIKALDLDHSNSKLSTIVANTRGAYEAVSFEEVDILGFPFSISETFQIRNTNATIEKSLQRVADIQSISIKNKKRLLIYISMGFGNPYGDEWSAEIVEKWVSDLYSMGIRLISLSDTIGVSSPESIAYIFSNLIPRFPDVEFGAHLHTLPNKWEEKVDSAYKNGCRKFDGAIKGYGGCPMAKDELTGNMPMENMISYFSNLKVDTGIDPEAFQKAMITSREVFQF